MLAVLWTKNPFSSSRDPGRSSPFLLPSDSHLSTNQAGLCFFASGIRWDQVCSGVWPQALCSLIIDKSLSDDFQFHGLLGSVCSLSSCMFPLMLSETGAWSIYLLTAFPCGRLSSLNGGSATRFKLRPGGSTPHLLAGCEWGGVWLEVSFKGCWEHTAAVPLSALSLNSASRTLCCQNKERECGLNIWLKPLGKDFWEKK